MNVVSHYSKLLKKQEFCWIHITDLRVFLYLGANQYEEKIGQNLRLDLSLKIQLNDTDDKLENTVDYSYVCEYITEKIKELNKIKLLEYLAEHLLNSIGNKFPKIAAARISIEKGYVPLHNFTGKIKIEAEKEFN
ncbi:dihydroneopterin aldolase [Fluviispira multicolorata]|uniref:dihydroneopterin aldolase n=1 Tax=Fluviispira multicolorata TaxID=2654512 RepID=A0A833JE46_9BACT|nr:dihydroneopterin aldolase [Fluviispira multicolorata]KAB8029679.1 FolB domain-containing protein [Fluviispira multicolorata]